MKVTGVDVALARKVLQTEAEAILALIERLDERFEKAVSILLDCRGRVIVTGMEVTNIALVITVPLYAASVRNARACRSDLLSLFSVAWVSDCRIG